MYADPVPLHVWIDHRFVRPGFNNVAGRLMKVAVPEAYVIEGAEVSTSLWIFKTPVADFCSFDHDSQLEQPQVSLGDIPTMVIGNVSGSPVQIELEPGCYYDAFCMAVLADGSRVLIGRGRYATTVDLVPSGFTFDQTKLLAGLYLGLSIEQMHHLQVRPLCFIRRSAIGSFAIVSYMFDLEGEVVGVEVDSLGIAQVFGGYRPEDIRQRLGS